MTKDEFDTEVKNVDRGVRNAQIWNIVSKILLILIVLSVILINI